MFDFFLLSLSSIFCNTSNKLLAYKQFLSILIIFYSI